MMSLENEIWLVVFIVIFLLASAFLWYCFILEREIKNEYRMIVNAQARFIRKAIFAESDRERINILFRSNILDFSAVDMGGFELKSIKEIRKQLERKSEPL
jgi:hypothetical protein